MVSGTNRVWRAIAARPRLFIGLGIGLVALPLLPGSLPPAIRGIVAWDIGVIGYLTLAAMLFTTERISRIAPDAAEQQEGEWTIFWLTLGGVIASFAAIIIEFARIKAAPADGKSGHVLLVAATLALSWLMTHTTFAFRYAHEYYANDLGGPDVDGGLEFPGETKPDYLDFMYFSLVLGMTFQVSDVQITSRKFRRLAAVHGLLSFLFNTIILALTVNLAAGLL
jgi:uncharacterized membrane protein